jgi:hypothetical protein
MKYGRSARSNDNFRSRHRDQLQDKRRFSAAVNSPLGRIFSHGSVSIRCNHPTARSLSAHPDECSAPTCYREVASCGSWCSRRWATTIEAQRHDGTNWGAVELLDFNDPVNNVCPNNIRNRLSSRRTRRQIDYHLPGQKNALRRLTIHRHDVSQ